MRLPALALTVAAVGVIAAPAPAPEPWCWRPGMPCWKVKRATEAFSQSIQTAGGLKESTPEAEYSNSPGGAAYKTKRLLDELAHLAALASENPTEYYQALRLENEFESDSGHKDKRAAAPEPWCWRPGMSCWKRDTSTDEIPVKDKRWCSRPGEPCWKAKRAADSVLEAVKSEDDTDKNQDPFSPGKFENKFPEECNGDRILCWKKREATPEASPEPWCWRPGMPCWKAKRDLHALEVAARNIIQSFE